MYTVQMNIMCINIISEYIWVTLRVLQKLCSEIILFSDYIIHMANAILLVYYLNFNCSLELKKNLGFFLCIWKLKGHGPAKQLNK